jgi:cytochrome c5
LLITALCGWAFGESIELKDGSKIEGKIKAKSATEITVDVEGIEVKVNGDEVKAIDGMPYACDFKALYDMRCQETPAMDIDGRFALAMWCKEHKLKAEMDGEIERVLALNPNHEGANRELGRLFVEGAWRTPDELKKLGFVKKNGEWMTPDQASQMEGKIQYMGNWLRPDDAKRFETQRFNRYSDYSSSTTHHICDLNAQIMRIELLNMWKPTKEQLQKMWPILNQAEADRQMFIAKMQKFMPEIEASWIALRNEAVRGVVDSFDQNPIVERKAGGNELVWIAAKKGAHYKLYTYTDKFLAVLAPGQKDVFYNKYCATCHSTSFMKGGMGKELRGTQAGVDFLEKVRAMSENDYNAKLCETAQEALKKFGKGTQTLLGKKANAAGKRSAQDLDAEEMVVADIFKRVRLAADNEWARTKFNFSAELEGKNAEERLAAIKTNACKEMGSWVENIKAQTMISDALFDGTLREVVAMKLKIPQGQLAVAPSRDADTIPEFKDGSTACQQMCTMCHSMDRINKAIKSPEGWRERVTGMLHKGLADDPKLVNMITEHLVNRGQKTAAK